MHYVLKITPNIIALYSHLTVNFLKLLVKIVIFVPHEEGYNIELFKYALNNIRELFSYDLKVRLLL